MIWELIQQAQIGLDQLAVQNAKSTADNAQAENRFLKARIERLEETVERVSLAAIAVAELLRDRLGVTESELEAKIQEIDLRDGKLNGRLLAPTHYCEKCRHNNSPNRRKCLYCGEPLRTDSELLASPSDDASPGE